MSFRARLRLFFVLIVIVPMLSVARVLFRLISDNETGKADSDIHARQHASIQLYGESQAEAERAVEAVGSDRVLAAALLRGDVDKARRRAAQLKKNGGIERVALSRGGKALVDTGTRSAVAPAQRDLTGTSGRRFGLLEASTTTADEYARDVRKIVGVDVIVRRGGRTIASTLRVAPSAIPRPGSPRNVDVNGDTYRAVTYRTADF